jgi:hypothetical protein
MYDGHDILPPLVPFHFPNRKLFSGAFDFDACNFCGPACAKGYLTWNAQISPMLLTWLHLFVHRDLKITARIPIAPSPRLLACNNKYGQGLTIQQYREFDQSHKLAEVISNLPIDYRVWVAQPQTNAEATFYEVYRDNKILADMLYEDAVATGASIPKTIINDIKAAEEAEAKERAVGIQAIATHLQDTKQDDAKIASDDSDFDLPKPSSDEASDSEPPRIKRPTAKPKPPKKPKMTIAEASESDSSVAPPTPPKIVKHSNTKPPKKRKKFDVIPEASESDSSVAPSLPRKMSKQPTAKQPKKRKIHDVIAEASESDSSAAPSSKMTKQTKKWIADEASESDSSAAAPSLPPKTTKQTKKRIADEASESDSPVTISKRRQDTIEESSENDAAPPLTKKKCNAAIQPNQSSKTITVKK